MRQETLFRSIMLVALLLQLGCSTLLPTGKSVAESPWLTYDDAKSAFDSVTVGVTTVEDLKRIGFDIKASPNLKVLNYLDIAASVQAIPMQELDPGLQACLRARADCRAYVFEPRRTSTKRIGNFWLDIGNFRRVSQETGWAFKALIVFVDHHVAYKLASGEPQIDQLREQVNPLGPLQFPTHLITGVIPIN